MKNLILSVFAILSLSLFAQTKEGHIAFTIDVSSDNPDMQMAIGMMQGSTMDMYFAPDKSRIDMKFGTIMSITSIADVKANKTLTLMGGMMGNMAIPMSMDDAKKADTLKAKMNVELVNETKVIAGYTCKKANVTDADGNVTVFWYTEELVASKDGQTYLNSQVPGIPLEYDINQKGMIMKLTAAKVEKVLEKSAKKTLFALTIPEGYKEMSQDDILKMGGM